MITSRWIWIAGVFATLGCTQPEPKPLGLEGCLLLECHGNVENAHYGSNALACVDCHGGFPEEVLKETAHPTVTVSFNPATPGVEEPGGVLLTGALQELDALDPAILKFLNPSDYRIAEDTCGSVSLGAGNCHTSITAASRMSTHATLAGQLAGGLYFGGMTDKEAVYGVMAVTDPFYTEAPGRVASLELLPADVSAMPFGGPAERGYYATFGQLCVECHLSRDGVKTPGKYTSSGCNACHLLTTDSSRPLTADITMDVEELGHGGLHRLTNLIPDDQCNRCHHAHLHRGLLTKGVREKSEPEGDTSMDGGVNTGHEDPENAVYWPEENYVRYRGAHFLYGKPYPFYIEDEDGTNDVDETPPDIHFEKGMACIDCHTMAELHGDDPHIMTRRAFETRVRCESCHGIPDADGAISLTGLPFVRALSTVGGGNTDNEVMIDDRGHDELTQLGKFSGLLHPVTQIARRVDPMEPRFNPRTLMGCGLHAGSAAYRGDILLPMFAATPADEVDEVFPGMPEGSTLPADLGTREGRVECFTCHNAWTLNCFGCHISRDDREMARNNVTGEMEAGKISTFAMSVIPDALTMGFNTRGKISPMVGTQIFFTHIDETGTKIVDAAAMTTVDGLSGGGNHHNPVHHHTVRRVPRDCDGCHPSKVTTDETFLKRAIGFGTGEFIFTDGEGYEHILDRLVAIDFDGDGVWDDPATTPLDLTAAAAMPLAATTHLPISDEAALLGPGPLDLVTINRLLSNQVVPQRPGERF